MYKTKTIIITSGIPCSGKSTWSNEMRNLVTTVICRDTIREMYFMRPYHYSKYNEDKVTEIFNHELEKFLCGDNSFDPTICILDNTHCKEKYIDQWIAYFKDKPEVNLQIKFFDIPLWKAYYRNYMRYFKTKKWIPLKVIWHMSKNYNKINKEKYARYLSV